MKSVVELEHTARLLAILLDSGRSVGNENQALVDDQGNQEQGFTPEVFERQLIDVFRARSGTDLRKLESARITPGAKKLLRELVPISKLYRVQNPNFRIPIGRDLLFTNFK